MISKKTTKTNSKIKARRDFKKVLLRSFFAHHPNCSQYNHHVFKIGLWRFCVGCSGLYSGIFLLFTLDVLINQNFKLIGNEQRLIFGFILFIPALFQLKWKSKIKSIKFLMRISLGFTTYFILSFIYFLESLFATLIWLLIFASVVYFYGKSQSAKQLIECESCKFGEKYQTCLTRRTDLLAVENIDLLKDEIFEIEQMLSLHERRVISEITDLPTIN